MKSIDGQEEYFADQIMAKFLGLVSRVTTEGWYSVFFIVTTKDNITKNIEQLLQSIIQSIIYILLHSYWVFSFGISHVRVAEAIKHHPRHVAFHLMSCASLYINHILPRPKYSVFN